MNLHKILLFTTSYLERTLNWSDDHRILDWDSKRKNLRTKASDNYANFFSWSERSSNFFGRNSQNFIHLLTIVELRQMITRGFALRKNLFRILFVVPIQNRWRLYDSIQFWMLYATVKKWLCFYPQYWRISETSAISFLMAFIHKRFVQHRRFWLTYFSIMRMHSK